MGFPKHRHISKMIDDREEETPSWEGLHLICNSKSCNYIIFIIC